ncbi:hypothetical protein [Embleya sp. NPDC001921]
MTVQILMFDFNGTEEEGSLEPVRDRVAGLRCVRLDPLELAPPAEYTDLAARAGNAIRDGRPDPGEPVAVLALCTAAPLAVATSRRLTESGYDVPLVQLFRPEITTAGHIRETYGDLAGRLGADAAEASLVVDRILAEHSDPRSRLAALGAGLRELGESWAERQGFDRFDRELFLGDLLERYDAWLNHLLSGMLFELPAVSHGRVELYRTRSGEATDAFPAGEHTEILRFEGDDGAKGWAALLDRAACSLSALGRP